MFTIIRHRFVLLTVIFLYGLFTPHTAYAEAPNPPAKERFAYFTPKLGFSPFTGIIGFEEQLGHWGWNLGIPLSGGIRYYFRPKKHSWYAGLYGQGFGYNHDETKDGIAYTHYSLIGGGAGGGYRWFWRERLSLELGIACGYVEEHRTNSFGERTDKGVIILPMASLGFSFH